MAGARLASFFLEYRFGPARLNIPSGLGVSLTALENGLLIDALWRLDNSHDGSTLVFPFTHHPPHQLRHVFRRQGRRRRLIDVEVLHDGVVAHGPERRDDGARADAHDLDALVVVGERHALREADEGVLARAVQGGQVDPRQPSLGGQETHDAFLVDGQQGPQRDAGQLDGVVDVDAHGLVARRLHGVVFAFVVPEVAPAGLEDAGAGDVDVRHVVEDLDGLDDQVAQVGPAGHVASHEGNSAFPGG